MAKQIAIGVDIGGTGIKGAVVNVRQGKFVGERVRIPTPADFTPAGVSKVVARVVQQLDHDGPIGIGFPAVVREGVVATPPTALAHPGWVGVDFAAEVTKRLGADGRAVNIVNDADAAGLAEMAIGAGRGHQGTVVVLTLGTGIGSATFRHGVLIPNTEFGRLYLGKATTAEHEAADRIRKAEELSWKEWGARLERLLQHLELLIAPDLIILSGGVSKKHEKFLPHINTVTRVVPAQTLNHAGILGAAAACFGAV